MYHKEEENLYYPQTGNYASAHVVSFWGIFKKRKSRNSPNATSENFCFYIYVSINHASKHCSTYSSKKENFKDFFFFTTVFKCTFSTPHPTKACYFLCVCFCGFMLFVGLQFSRCLNSLMAREFGHSYQSGNTLSVPSVLISE